VVTLRGERANHNNPKALPGQEKLSAKNEKLAAKYSNQLAAVGIQAACP
jgi:hypothetical protein